MALRLKEARRWRSLGQSVLSFSFCLCLPLPSLPSMLTKRDQGQDRSQPAALLEPQQTNISSFSPVFLSVFCSCFLLPTLIFLVPPIPHPLLLQHSVGTAGSEAGNVAGDKHRVGVQYVRKECLPSRAESTALPKSRQTASLTALGTNRLLTWLLKEFCLVGYDVLL